MSLEARTSPQITKDLAFKDLTEMVDKLTLAMEANFKNTLEQLRQELGPRSRRGSQEMRRD